MAREGQGRGGEVRVDRERRVDPGELVGATGYAVLSREVRAEEDAVGHDCCANDPNS